MRSEKTRRVEKKRGEGRRQNVNGREENEARMGEEKNDVVYCTSLCPLGILQLLLDMCLPWGDIRRCTLSAVKYIIS